MQKSYIKRRSEDPKGKVMRKNEDDDSKMEVEETTTTTTAGDDTSGIFNIYGTDNPDVLKVFEEETDENLMVAMLDLYNIDVERGQLLEFALYC